MNSVCPKCSGELKVVERIEYAEDLIEMILECQSCPSSFVCVQEGPMTEICWENLG